VRGRLDRPDAVAKVVGHTLSVRVVAARGVENVQVMPDRILDARHRAIVKERGLERGVAKR
jgi:hypothetical protein